MSVELDPLPSQPWNQDVRIWRNGHTAEPAGASIPRSVIWHSPDGFNFGYGGSGAADLALNILNAFLPPAIGRSMDDDIEWAERDDDPVKCYQGVCSRFAARWHQAFKREFIASIQSPGGTITAATIKAWISQRIDSPANVNCAP
jgi:hypothetical protein